MLAGAAATARPVSDWGWLFPLTSSAPAAKPADATPRQLPGSAQRFTNADVHDLKHAVDWFPAEHPRMPAIVSTGHGNANACGYCHLPAGNGRPENSSLAGLPADYIRRQVQAFADGTRQSVSATSSPPQMMAATAKAVSGPEIDQAAAYFSKLRYTSNVHVVETASLAFSPSRFIYVLNHEPKRPIGGRIIEVAVDPAGFELRDPHASYVAYVPPGSIAAGRALVASGGPARRSCAMCHGEGLRGGAAPPLAGRSPTTMMRQLAAFQSGTRSNAEAAPMRAVAGPLDAPSMIAIASYAASLRP